MNDYNNGTLQDPCLRLDYGFGEEWASVELGDGTGYVRLADYEKLASENTKLRELLSMYMTFALAEACGHVFQIAHADGMGKVMDEAEMRKRAMELGIEWCR